VERVGDEPNQRIFFGARLKLAIKESRHPAEVNLSFRSGVPRLSLGMTGFDGGGLHKFSERPREENTRSSRPLLADHSGSRALASL
jgi:hypothetical protein